MMQTRPQLKNGLAILLGLVLSALPVCAASLLTNPGFEADPQGQSAALLGWNTYSGSSGNVWSETSASLAHTGTNYLKVYQAFNGSVNYNGVTQDNISGPGAVYSADGWAYTLSSDVLAGQNEAWIEVTFRDAAANVLALYRSEVITTNLIAKGTFPKSSWVHLFITNQYNPSTYVVTNTTNQLVAPAGTSFVRYQVMFQGDAAYSAGSMYFDDLNLVQTAGQPQGNWNIVWSDEFTGSSIISSNWGFDIGNNNGWGNNELEYYTSLSQNAYVSNGFLNLVALNQSYDGYNYTSARINSAGHFTAQYGRIAFRVKVPTGQGLWPALWLYPESSVYGGWAASGEIDVMETIGSNPTNIFGTLQFGGPYPDNAQSHGPSFNFLPGTSVANFNIYTLEWTSNAINWYINGLLYETQTSWWSSSNTNNTQINPYPAPFNQPFFVIMNIAVGGTLGGTVSNSIFPSVMQVDYVRYYNLTQPLQITATQQPGKMVLTWPSNIVCHLEYATSASGPWNGISSATSPYTANTTATTFFYRLMSP